MIEDDDEIRDALDIDEEQLVIPDTLPLLPVRDVVIFPFMIVPLFVGRDRSINAVDAALTKDRLIFAATQKDITDEDPNSKDIYRNGTVCMIMRMLKLPDGRVKILVQGLTRASVKKFAQTKPSYLVEIAQTPEIETKEATLQIEALMRNVKEQLERLASLGKVVFQEVMMIVENITDPGRMADLVASNLGLKIDESQEILEMRDPMARLRKVSEHINKELQVSQMQAHIQSQAKDEMDKSQREYFLREQMRAIKNELGDLEESNEESDELRTKITKANMPPAVEKEASKQADRLDMMHPDAAEAGLIRTYLEWLTDLPWANYTKDVIDLKKAKEILDTDHYGLEKIKERILEFLAVRKLKNDTKGPILCFVGPPGVGKTSLGKSIARSMGREFVRISLGGIKDEAEIRGHRRTYVGALPGRIIQGIKQAGTTNPVFMMDEIDKIGTDFRGDPSSALLEVLDPEQNNAFSDHYLNVPYDLSNVMFVMTANTADPIPAPLRDRMEIIYLSGYTEEDKLQIARKYVVPRQITEHGLTRKLISIADATTRKVISEYTREAGLRSLEREVASICRKVARKVAGGRKTSTAITQKNLHEYLGVPRYLPEDEQKRDEIGVSTGLAWTPVGGEILYIEATVMKGRGALSLTGQLGDVMKESAQAALSYTRSRADKLGITDDFKTLDIHIHVPSGAIPKDGPSAGVTMATAIISALTKTPVRRDVAMTGEITLRGRVLPIGGLKEKALAALRAKMTTVIMPERNEKDLSEIPPDVRKKMKFRPVKHMDDVIKIVFRKDTVKAKKAGGAKSPRKKATTAVKAKTGAKKATKKGRNQPRA
ncbi:MAG: endopeptidase La [Proteobacteria bacterium]|nr:endopeptidase La [Pseudomonadota bacterium]